MNIAVSFEKDSASPFYEILIKRFQDSETAVYGNNLTHWFPRGPRDFNNYGRLDDALRHPELIIVLYSREYYKNDWLRSELDAFLQLERFRDETDLVLIIPVGNISLSEIPHWYHAWINPSVRFENGDEGEMLALAAYISTLSHSKLNRSQPNRLSNRVFIVHGHDHVAKGELEIFLAEIGLEPIVLHRESHQGMTTIERLVKHSDVSYSIVLYTLDDSVRISPKGGKSGDSLEHRARQNVIFEFGFFVGKLGRDRVCFVYQNGVSRPSDIEGLSYVGFRDHIAEAKWDIMKELRKAGFDVNLKGS
jgi:predicted nucleotide-binding protein